MEDFDYKMSENRKKLCAVVTWLVLLYTQRSPVYNVEQRKLQILTFEKFTSF